MMNQMTQPLGPVNFSEEDLRKLAMLLQQMPANEGLASVTRQEQDLMRNAGGTGTPLPGTQGLGPAGGPVKSYAKKEDGRLDEDHRIAILTDAEVDALNYLKHQDKDQGYPTGNGPFIQALASMNTHELDYHTVKGMSIPSLNAYGGLTEEQAQQTVTTANQGSNGGGNSGGKYVINNSGKRVWSPYGLPGTHHTLNTEVEVEVEETVQTEPKDTEVEAPYTGPDRGNFETRPEVIQGRDTKAGQSGDWNAHLAQGGTTWDGTGDQPVKSGYQPGSTGTGTTATTTTPGTVTPTKYNDKNGNEYDSQDEANAANVTIDANIATIEGLTLTTDTTFTSWMLANKDTYSIPPNSEAGLEGAFNNAKIIATDAASVELPKMVDSMNVFLRDNDLGASASYDEWAATYTKPANLSETTMRTMYAKAVFKAERKEAFTLTTEELESWMRPPVVLATKGNFNEWWEGKKGQFKDGTFDDMDFAIIAHKAAIVGDAEAVTIGTVGDADTTTIGTIADADAVTVGDVDPVTGTVTGTGDVTAPTVEFGDDITEDTVNAIQAVTDADMDTIFAGGLGEDATGIDEAEALLVARVEGTAVSPAEVQLKRSVENNLRMLLGATVGADVDPARVRQLRNIWADMTQEVTGKAAEIRSTESMAAEKELVALYQGKSTMKLQARLANLEVQKQTAFKNADLALAAKLANQATRLAELITQANIDRDLSVADLKARTDKMIAQGTMDLSTALANLQVKKDLAIAQGKTDVALSLANLQKNILLAQVNVEVAVKQRAMDDAIAMIAYKGEMALMGLEVEIDTVELNAGLTEMGFKLSRDLAELDSATQIRIAELTKEWRMAQGNDQKQAAIIGSMGTLLTGLAIEWVKSDIRAKTNISPGGGEVESFLDALNAYTYEYKDPDAPGADAGMFAGVMAQDLEKTPMGASFVQDTPNGKRVDYGHGLAAILASQANIHDRLKQLEEV